MRLAHVWDVVAVLVALAVFAALSLYQIDLPGLYYDEALDAVPAMDIVQRQPVDLLRGAGVWLRGYGYPLMAMDYVGPVNTYLLVPFFRLLGVSSLSIRLMTVSASALTILLYYFWARHQFNRVVASGTALLLATSPSFIFYSRQGIHVTSVITVMASGALLSLLVWRRSGRVYFLWLACFLLGVGFSAKILFLWYVLALTALGLAAFVLSHAATLIEGRRHLKPRSRNREGVYSSWPPTGDPADGITDDRPKPEVGSKAIHRLRALMQVVYTVRGTGTGATNGATADLAAALKGVFPLLSFLAGAFPIIWYNVLTRGTLEVIGRNVLVSSDGVNNLAFLENLRMRWIALQALLDGGHFWFLGGMSRNSVAWPIFLGAAILGLILLLHRSAGTLRRPTLFVYGLMVLVLVQSIVTISGLGPTHLFILLPLPQLVVVLAAFLFFGFWRDVSQGWRRGARRATLGAAGLLSVGVVVAFLAGDIRADLAYHRLLGQTGGYLSHSDAIYRLAEYLDSRSGTKPVAMDWGISTSVQILTEGRVRPREIFVYAKDPPPLFSDLLFQRLNQTESLYIFRSEDVTVFPRREQFQYWVDRLGKKAVLEKEITQRDGKVLYFVYRVDNPS